MTQSTTFHDVLDPFGGQRVSLRLEGGRLVDRSASLPSGLGRHFDGSGLWFLDALYDADAHLPLLGVGLRPSDAVNALHGGVARMNVALQWQEIRHLELGRVLDEVTSSILPAITPILSVHSDLPPSEGFGEWLKVHAETVASRMPPVCKLYSYSEGFWRDLDAVFEAGLLPVIYCRDIDSVVEVVNRAPGPVHFRHAVSAELVATMGKLPGATLQTSPHFLVPIDAAWREQLNVLPPIPDDDVRRGLAELVMDDIDLVVSDHNAPPFGPPGGPGLQVQQSFLSAILYVANQYGWSLPALWAKVTTAPARRYGVDLGETFAIIDPEHVTAGGLWPPRQTPDRAPFAGVALPGRVVAIGRGDTAVII